jgi:hypothetical protein
VLNKVLPSYLRRTAATGIARQFCAEADRLAEAVGPDVGPTDAVARVVREVGNSFLNYQVVATREAEQRAELARTPEVVASVPYFDADIHDLAGLIRLGEAAWR